MIMNFHEAFVYATAAEKIENGADIEEVAKEIVEENPHAEIEDVIAGIREWMGLDVTKSNE